MIQFLVDNMEWIFSGIGIFILTFVINYFKKNGSTVKQVQKSGSNSTNYQSSGDINIGNKDVE